MPRTTEMVHSPPQLLQVQGVYHCDEQQIRRICFYFILTPLQWRSTFHNIATGFLSLLIPHFTLLYKCSRLPFCCYAAWFHFRNGELFHNLRGICNAERNFRLWEKIFSNRQFWTVFYMWPAMTVMLSIKFYHVQKYNGLEHGVAISKLS
jgi:hypothetical protein